jgi:hypothetical protein
MHGETSLFTAAENNMKREDTLACSSIGPGTRDLELRDGIPARLEQATGQRIEALAGIAWITVTGVTSDIMLRAGQVWEIPNEGLVLMEAVGHGKVRLHAAAAHTRRA